jgi:SH3-like domain-containing protein
MKRILAVLIAVMLLVAAIPATSMAEIVSNGDNKVYHASTNGGTLRVHREASLNAAIVTSVPNGTALQQTSSKTVKKDGHVWMKIKTSNGTSGWVSKKWVKENAHADVNTQKDGLNVRTKRSSSSKKTIIYSIPHGTKGVTVYKVNGNWAYVSYRGMQKGWASLGYLRWARW